MKRQNRAYSGRPHAAAHPPGQPHRLPCPAPPEAAARSRKGAPYRCRDALESSQFSGKTLTANPRPNWGKDAPQKPYLPSASSPRSAVHGGPSRAEQPALRRGCPSEPPACASSDPPDHPDASEGRPRLPRAARSFVLRHRHQHLDSRPPEMCRVHHKPELIQSASSNNDSVMRRRQ